MKAYIDRIEEGIAVIVIEGKNINIPAELLGIEVHEGMHLNIKFEADTESEEATKDRIKKLQEELLNRNKEDK